MYTFPIFIGNANKNVIALLMSKGVTYHYISGKRRLICRVDGDKELYDKLIDASNT